MRRHDDIDFSLDFEESENVYHIYACVDSDSCAWIHRVTCNGDESDDEQLMQELIDTGEVSDLEKAYDMLIDRVRDVYKRAVLDDPIEYTGMNRIPRFTW